MEYIRKLLEEGKYGVVIQYYKEKPPETSQDFLYLGIALFYSGFREESVKTFEAGLEKFPNDADLLINTAEVYYQLNQYEKAFEYAKRIIELGIDDPYIYDIVASYYKILGKEKLKRLEEFFAEKSYELLKEKNASEAEMIKRKYHIPLRTKKRRKMLIIGSCANYGDSFVKFVEDDWEIYVLKTSTWKTFMSNYESFAEMGAKFVKEEDLDDFIKYELPNIDLVFRTGYFYGGDDTHRIIRFYDIRHFNYIYKISRWIKEKKMKAKVVLAFDGDTFVHDPFWAEWLSKRLVFVDYILFDTENLRKYFLKHVSLTPSTKTDVMLVEVPLKRELKVRIYDRYRKCVLTMGRSIPSYIPIVPNQIVTLDTPLALGGGGGYIKRLTDREEFAAKYGDIAFGLGYFHDFYLSDYSFEEILERSLEHMTTPMRFSNYLPMVYAYTNVPGKVISYLQFGIIPILPRNGNDFYEKLFQKGMAIPIDRNVEYFDPEAISDKEISEIRKNILQHSDIFIFDRFFDFVNQILEGE